MGEASAGRGRRKRVNQLRGFRCWRLHLDEIYVKLNGGWSTSGERWIMKARY